LLRFSYSLCQCLWDHKNIARLDAQLLKAVCCSLLRYRKSCLLLHNRNHARAATQRMQQPHQAELR
jgi:hypothetical protein